jgi:hypothetical protein
MGAEYKTQLRNAEFGMPLGFNQDKEMGKPGKRSRMALRKGGYTKHIVPSHLHGSLYQVGIISI